MYGIESVSYELPEETTQEELMAIVDKCNKDPKINGILVQLPLQNIWMKMKYY